MAVKKIHFIGKETKKNITQTGLISFFLFYQINLQWYLSTFNPKEMWVKLAEARQQQINRDKKLIVFYKKESMKIWNAMYKAQDH